MQLVAQHGAQTHQLVAMPEQLPKITFLGGGNPDFREAIGKQEIQNQRGIPLVGLLLSHFAGPDFRGIPDPKFMTQFAQQTFEPLKGASGFDSKPDRLAQAAVEGVRLSTFVVESSLDEFAGGFVHHGDLLIACMKIATYNQHCSAPLFRALVVLQQPSLLGGRSRQRHLISPPPPPRNNPPPPRPPRDPREPGRYTY